MSLLALTLLCATATAESPVPLSYRTRVERRIGFFSAKVRYPDFSGDTPLGMAAQNAVKREVDRIFGTFVKAAKEMGSERPTAPWELDVTTETTLNDSGLVSLFLSAYDYSGGAHPNRFYVPITLGLKGGRPTRLTAAEMFAGGKSAVDALVLPELLKRGAQNVASGEMKTLGKLADQFVVTPSGITWLFQPYDVGPYAQGEFNVNLLWKRLSPRLSPGVEALDAVLGTIEISATTRLRIALPANAAFRTRLIERGGEGKRVISETKVQPIGSRATWNATLRFPKGMLAPNAGYVVEAEIAAGGRIYLRAVKPVVLDIKRRPLKLELTLGGG